MAWWQLTSLDSPEVVEARTLLCLRNSHDAPWKTIGLLPYEVASIVMDVIQRELDDESAEDKYRSTCMKCLRELGKKYDIVPSSFFCRDVTRKGPFPVSGGGFADIYQGSMSGSMVCLKVLRLFLTGHAREELIKDCCREALIWKQLRHPNVLPFLGVSSSLFSPSFCLISPWMANGNIMTFLQSHPTHDKMHAVIEISEGLQYLHSLDPQIVHADIRGANILVGDEGRCCLDDFGLSLVAESQAAPRSSVMGMRGSIRWVPPELMESEHLLFDVDRISARDIYSFGCTIIEIFTGKAPFSHIKFDVAILNEVLTLGKKPPRPPNDEMPSDHLWALVMACLSRRPKDRPTAAHVLRSLKEMKGVCTFCPFQPDVVCHCRELRSRASTLRARPRRSDSVANRPTLTVQTSNLPPSSSRKTSPAQSSTSGGQPWVSETSARPRPRGPRSALLASPFTKCIETSSSPSPTYSDHSAPSMQVLMDSESPSSTPEHSPVLPLVIKKKTKAPNLLEPSRKRGKLDSPTNLNAAFKQWASKPRDVTLHPIRRKKSPEMPSRWIRAHKIGEGTYSHVYAAMDADTGAWIAVKEIQIPVHFAQYLTVRVKGMHHASVKRLFGRRTFLGFLGTSRQKRNSQCWFAEYVSDGKTLYDILEDRGPFGDSHLSRWLLSQIVSAVAYIHEEGVMHRDLKAENIIVDSTTGLCKLSGFGISKRIDDLGARTKTPVHGAVYLAAPENVLTGTGTHKGYGVKVDVWSIGCVACELWVGTRRRLVKEMMDEMTDRWFASPRPPPPPDGLSLSVRAESFRLRCFAPDPEERASADELNQHPYLTMLDHWTFEGFP